MDNFENDFNNYRGQPNHEINSRYGRSEYRGSRRYDDEEVATEFMTNEVMDGNATSGALIAGIVGIVAAIVALFTYSFILGAIGVACGVFAAAKGNKVIGITSICIGLVAALTPLFFAGSFMSLF